jgi:cytochrome c biogenesis protein CcdA
MKQIPKFFDPSASFKSSPTKEALDNCSVLSQATEDIPDEIQTYSRCCFPAFCCRKSKRKVSQMWPKKLRRLLLLSIMVDLVQLSITFLGMVILFILILTARPNNESALAAVVTIVTTILYALIYIPRMSIVWQTLGKNYTIEANVHVRKTRLVTSAVVVIL